MDSLIILVTTDLGPGAIQVPFEAVHTLKTEKRITDINLEFVGDNSYFLSLRGRYFIIKNGANSIRYELGQYLKNPELLLIRRHHIDVGAVDNKIQKEGVSYLLGLKGEKQNGLPIEVFLHITDDGRKWCRTDKR